jgi:hypothetical protein
LDSNSETAEYGKLRLGDYFTAETLSTQRPEYFLIKNFSLRVLCASAVNNPKFIALTAP